MKQGNWIVTDNGLGSPTFVYLKKDEGKGFFSAWFYNPDFGLECADWAVFSKQYYPDSRLLTPNEISNIDKKVLDTPQI